jgi:PAS domain S-box-containing protein
MVPERQLNTAELKRLINDFETTLNLVANDQAVVESSGKVSENVALVENTWLPLKGKINTAIDQSASVISLDVVGLDSTAGSKDELVKQRNTLQQSLSDIQQDERKLTDSLSGLISAYKADAADARSSAIITLSLTLLSGIVLITIIFWILKVNVHDSLSSLGKASAALSQGDLDYQLARISGEEANVVAYNLEQMKDSMTNAATFAEKIGTGEFNFQFTPLSEKDKLGKALINMRDTLQDVSHEDNKRRWATEGLAGFSDILRNDQSNLGKLSNDVITHFVKYMGANQGAIFIVNDEEEENPFLELVACYAWDKKKFLEKRISPGEGITGQVWLEKEMIYLKQVPNDFITITSGLGNANPKTVIVVPLKINDDVYGIIELASFKEYDQYELDFVTKVSENIASTIAGVKINERTRRLLEQSQQQAEELRAQEEEVRQNMEELQSTQEEMLRKNIEMEGRMRAIDESGVASVEFNLDGTIRSANENFLKMMGYASDEVIGKHHRMFVHPSERNSKEYLSFWEDLSKGIPRPGEYSRVDRSGKKVVIKGSYSVIRDTDMKPLKILKLATDITTLAAQSEEGKSFKRAIEHEYKVRENAFGYSMVLSETDVYGTITFVNDKFCQVAKYKRDELIGKPHNIVRHPDMPKALFKLFWDTIQHGRVFQGIVKNKAKDGSHYWVHATIVPVKDEAGNVVRYVGARYHIEDDGIAELMYNKQARILGFPLISETTLKEHVTVDERG